MQPSGQKAVVNGWHNVAAYPVYVAGLDGWRQALATAGNARAKQRSAGFWAWLRGAARALDPANLLGALHRGV